MLPSGTPVRGFKTRPKPSDFFERKISNAFLRKGSKAVGPVSQIFGTLKNPYDYVEVESGGKIQSAIS
jgi:rRNA processing protein Gar1